MSWFLPGVLRSSRVSQAVFLFLLAPALHGGQVRMEFIARAGGERVAGAEVCFFKAGFGPGPVDKFAGEENFRCLPADQVIEMPAGRWAFVVRHQGKKLMSTNPAILNVRTAGSPEDDLFHQSMEDMVKAGVLDLSRVNGALRPDDRLALYISNQGAPYFPLIVPIPRGADAVLAPAGMPLLLLLMQHSRVLNVSDPFTVGEDARFVAPSFPAVAEDKGNVLTWIQFPSEARMPVDQWIPVPAASAILEAGGHEYKPASAVRDGFGADGSLLFFRNVPLGKHTVTLRSPFWTAATLDVEIERPGVTMPTQGLITQPAAALTVEWSVAAPPVTTNSECGTSKGERPKTDTAPLAANLYACEGMQPAQPPATVDRNKCKRVAEPVSIDARSRRAIFHGVKAGSYLVGVHEPGVGNQYAITTVTVGQETKSVLSFESFNVLGRVRLDGKPLRARLEFTSGTAYTDADGYYVGSLRRKPLRFVRVIRCSDDADLGTRVSAKPIEAGVPHDIEITSNEMRVQVVDAQTRRPVAKSVVTIYSVAETGDEALFEPAASDSDGSMTVHDLPQDFMIRICASADRYENKCIEPFFFDERKRSAEVKLSPLNRSGRIRTDHPLSPWSAVFFVGPEGAIRERVPVRSDGAFDFRLPHAGPEYVVVTCPDLPLFVFPLGEMSADTLEIAVPQLPVRTIALSIAPETAKKDALIALFLDGRYIPQQAQGDYQAAHGYQPMILGRGPLLMPDLAARNIRVALGPAMSELPPNTDIPDFVLDPRYGSKLIFKEVDATNRIVF